MRTASLGVQPWLASIRIRISLSIAIGFIATYAIMRGPLGAEAWRALGALCGSWMGGSGNMIAVQAALDIGEADMAYALVVDSIDYSIWVMFLLWAINLAPKFNKWVKADTRTLDEVSKRLEKDAKANDDRITFVNIIFLLGLSLVISAVGQNIGVALNGAASFLDKATWTVLFITLAGLAGAYSGALVPVGVLMALMGYVIGTGGGIIVANIMSMFA